MDKIKIGILGTGRDIDIAENLNLLDCQIVALCDFNEKRLSKGLGELPAGVTAYGNFDDFIEQDMDAVVLANYFHKHTPYAIKCFEKGIHVFCECIPNSTLAEGVELVRAYEKSDSIFMLAENYPQMKFNREMKRICDGGGDYIVARMFLDTIREGKEPEHPYDIYSAVTMANVAILAHRSILNDGATYDIPDFRKEDCRKEYENDRQSPFVYSDGTKPTIPCCSNPDFMPTEEQLKLYNEAMKD